MHRPDEPVHDAGQTERTEQCPDPQSSSGSSVSGIIKVVITGPNNGKTAYEPFARLFRARNGREDPAISSFSLR